MDNDLVKRELDFLEQLEKEQPIIWCVDFWKLTDDVTVKLQQIVDRWKLGNGREKVVELPDGFMDKMIRQIIHYNKHKIKIDGTTPTDRELKRIENNGML